MIPGCPLKITKFSPVLGIAVQVAPLPHDGVGPLVRLVQFSFLLHLLVLPGEEVSGCHIAHHREEPFAHAPGEVLQLFLFARLRCKIPNE